MERKDKSWEARKASNRLPKTVLSKVRFAVVLTMLSAFCITAIDQKNTADNKIEKGNDLSVDSAIPEANCGGLL